jgi:VCBS repeat protein/IPT/TIG domain-containing protein
MNRTRILLSIIAEFSENHAKAAGIGKLLVTTSLLIGLFACGGGSSASAPPPPSPNPSAVPFINQPLVPAATAPGGTGFTLTVNGTGFVSGSVVQWNGSALTTTFASSAKLTANVSASDIASAGTASVTVFNPAPGGGTSNPAFLQITPPSGSVNMASAYYGTGNLSYGIVAADFRGDGKLDLAETGNGIVGVLLGNGDGTLQGQVTYNVGGAPWALAAGDFNGDGKLDLVVTATGPAPNANAFSILLANGDGTFQAPVNYATGGFPYAAAVGDFNRDGHLDLVVANYYDATVSILFGNGDGTFQPQVAYSCGCQLGPTSVAVGDLNGDGILDLVVVDDPGVYVLLGNDNGTFQTPVAYATGTFWGHQSVLVADFNADGKLDVAVADLCGPQTCGGPGAVSILLGNGDGTLQPDVDYPGGSSPTTVAVGDFNGDGKIDLAVANSSFGTGSASIVLGNGDGTFQAPLTFAIGENFFMAPLAVGDFNADGKLDLAADVANGVAVLLQTSP